MEKIITIAAVAASCESCGREENELGQIRLREESGKILTELDPKWRTLHNVPLGDAIHEFKKMSDRMVADPVKYVSVNEHYRYLNWEAFGAVHDGLVSLRKLCEGKRGVIQIWES